MCSSGSTSNRLIPGGARFVWILWLAIAAALLSGCADSGRPPGSPVEVRGYADLNVLVRRHPGWRGVGQYDQALARLQAAAQAHPVKAAPSIPATLPPAIAGAPHVPPQALQGERSRLEQVKAAQMARLRRQLDDVRLQRLKRERETWGEEALRRYPDPQPGVDQAAADLERRSLDLMLEIASYQHMLHNWIGLPPGTPWLVEVRRRMAAAEHMLSAVNAQRQTLARTTQARQAAALAQARADRTAYVQTQAAQVESALLSQEQETIMQAETRLSARMTALLHRGRSMETVSVPPAGSLGAVALPPIPVAATTNEGWKSAQARLQAQRARWIAFLYDDTRAAALDAAQQRHWTITFAPPRPGERDLTSQLASALAAQLWRISTISVLSGNAVRGIR